MVPRSTPDSRIHTRSVEPDSASGRPDEKPSSKTISTRRCKYTAHPSRQEARGAAGFLAGADAASGAVMKTVLADSAGGASSPSPRSLRGEGWGEGPLRPANAKY